MERTIEFRALVQKEKPQALILNVVADGGAHSGLWLLTRMLDTQALIALAWFHKYTKSIAKGAIAMVMGNGPSLVQK